MWSQASSCESPDMLFPPPSPLARSRFQKSPWVTLWVTLFFGKDNPLIRQKDHGRLRVVLFKVTESRPKDLGDKDKARGTSMAGDRELWTPKPSRSCLPSQTFEEEGQNCIQKNSWQNTGSVRQMGHDRAQWRHGSSVERGHLILSVTEDNSVLSDWQDVRDGRGDNPIILQSRKQVQKCGPAVDRYSGFWLRTNVLSPLDITRHYRTHTLQLVYPGATHYSLAGFSVPSTHSQCPSDSSHSRSSLHLAETS